VACTATPEIVVQLECLKLGTQQFMELDHCGHSSSSTHSSREVYVPAVDNLLFCYAVHVVCREAVQFIAANILRLAAAGADIAGLDSALITSVAKVRPLLLLLLLGMQLIALHEPGATFSYSIPWRVQACGPAIV
jgi:hypothetical protein